MTPEEKSKIQAEINQLPPEDRFDPTEEPSTPPVPTPTADQSPNTGGVMDTLKDIGTDIGVGMVRGAEGAGAGIRQTARGIADATGLSTIVGDKDTNAQPLEMKSQDPAGKVGEITASITQAALGYALGRVAVGKAVGVLGAMKQAAVGIPLVANADQERLSNVLMQYPWLAPIVAPLAQDPTDSVLTSKVKAGIEEVLMVGGVGKTFGVAGQVFKSMQLLYMKASGKFTPAFIQKAEEDLVRAEVSTNGSISGNGQKSLEELNPVVNNQAAKDATQKVIGEKYGDTGAAFRAMQPEEMQSILSTGKVHVGENPEGISAQLIGKESTAVYHNGDGMIVRAGEHEPSGRFGEVHVKETTDPRKASFMIGGKEMSFDEAKAALAEAPKAAPAAAKPVLTLRSSDGSSGVTLTPTTQKRFENLMDKVIIRDTVQGTTPLPAGPMAKEGTMNAAFQESPPSVLKGLLELGKMTKAQLGPKVRSMEDVRATASMFGQQTDELLANLKSANMSVEHIDAIATGTRQYIQLKGAEMFAAGRKAMLSGDPEARAAFQTNYLHLAEVQAEFAQLQTGLGRGLHSLGESVGPFDPAKLAAKLANPEEAAKLERLVAATDGDADKIMHILKMQQLSWFQKAVGTHNEYWTGLGLLSRAATQTVNLGSTLVQGVMEPTAMLVGGVERGLTGKGWAEAREAIGIYGGMRTAFFDSMHMAWQAMKTEQAVISQAGTMEQPTKYISALTYNMNPDTFGGKFIDLMGNITRASFRGLTAGDEFFKQLSYRAKVSATASREATDMVKAGTLKREEVAQYVAEQLQASIDDLGRATNPDALKYAEKAAFVQDLKGATWGDYTSIGESMARVSSSNPIIRGVLTPFIKTPTNVTRTTFEYTPLIGQLRKQFYTDVAAGGEKQAMALGKLTIGAGMYAGAAMLALEGRITGAPPAPGVAVPPGWKPYSFVFHGEHLGPGQKDLYISYQRMQPFGDVLGLTADFVRSTGMLDPDTRDGLANMMVLSLSKMLDGDMSPATNVATAVGAAYGKSLISKTYFRNMTEFFSTFSGYNNEALLVRWVQNYTASHVPGALSQFNSDDTVREVRSTLDAVMARIPGLSQQLPAKRDYVGRVQDIKRGFPFSIVQPLAVSETQGDPVMEELSRLSHSNAQTKFIEPEHLMTIAGRKVDLKLVKNSEGVTAWDRMVENLQTAKPVGEKLTFHDKLREVMASPRYKLGAESDTLDGNPMYPGIRQNLIKREETAYRTAALDAMKNEFKSELGIKSALDDTIQTKIGRRKVGAGIYDKILELNK